MSIEMLLPELGENITSGVVVKVLVREGEPVESGQPVIELETDKAVVEVPADRSGVVTAVHVREGDEIPVGGKILSLNPLSDSGKTKAAEPEAPKSGIAAGGAPEDESPTAESATPAARVDAGKPASREKPLPAVPAAPSVRRFAREIGVDIRTVTGSGPSGRISVDDVKNHAKARFEQPEAIREDGIGAAGPAVQPLPDFSRWGEVDAQPMTMVRRKTAEHLGHAWSAVPQVTQFDRADITHLETFRKAHAAKAVAAGGKLTVTAILLKITAAALQRFPKFNAAVDMEKRKVVYKKYVHIGVAVDTDRGLLVPVVRDVPQKSLIDLAVDLARLSEAARSRKLSLEEMQGGNFTISNLGGIGGTGFTPIVNAPEVAILGVSGAETAPVFRNDRFEPRLMLPLSLSYDHRLIDGAEAARFLRWIAQAVEQPLLLSLG